MLRAAGYMVRRTTKISNNINIVNFWAACQNGLQLPYSSNSESLTSTIQESAITLTSMDYLLNATQKLTIANSTDSYKLPAYKQYENIRPIILDPLTQNSIELPSGLRIPKITPHTLPNVEREITAPGQNVVEKKAKSALKQRRRHMNKHKLKKLRKRMKFVYMKLAQKKFKKKRLLLQQECEGIVNSAKNWDPLEEITHDLEKARKGGFGIDVFERKSL